MKKNEMLISLIQHFFEFDAGEGNREEYSMNDFAGYLSALYCSSGRPVMREISGNNKEWLDGRFRNSSSDISILIVLLNRYARWYIKKALHNSNLQTPDEFSFLITLMTYDSLTKSELISKQVMEKSSGIEVIRRLIKNGFMAETEDAKDKRSIRVYITVKGREEILRILPLMSNVASIITGNLSDEEINTLLYLLKKLDYFHNEIYMKRKNASLEEIASQSSRFHD